MPIFAKDILHGDSKTMGFLMSMAGVGALVGAMYLASRKSIKGLTKKMVFAAVVFSFALIVFSFSNSLFLSMGLMLIVGLGMMFQMATSNTILQSVVDDDMRGRVMSLHSMAFMSVAPFGSLLVGFMSKNIGAPMSLTICAVICLLWALYGISLQGNLSNSINQMLQKHEQASEPESPSAFDVADITPALNK
jgi:MFS family permease